jgi:hypothetical protein
MTGIWAPDILQYKIRVTKWGWGISVLKAS